MLVISINSRSQSLTDLLSLSNVNMTQKQQENCPEFYKLLNEERIKGNVKGIYFGAYARYNVSAVFTIDNNFIFINQQMLATNDNESYLIWTFIKAVSDINYLQTNKSIDSIQFFKNRYITSLNRAKTLAENGDCKVLRSAVADIKYLSNVNNSRKLKQVIISILNDPIYETYNSFLQQCDLLKNNEDLKLTPIQKTSPLIITNQDSANILQPANEVSFEKKILDERAISIMLEDYKYSYDDMTGVTCYFDKRSPKYYEENGFFLYIKKDRYGTYDLWLRVQLNISSYFKLKGLCLLQTDKDTYQITSRSAVQKYSQAESSGWFEIHATNHIINVINDVISSNKVKLRYYDEANFTSERHLKSKEIEALKDVLTTFNIITGR